MTDNSSQMQDTMNEIEKQDIPAMPVNLRDNLKTDISNLEKELITAKNEIIQLDHDAPSHTPISPELANEQKRHIVFLNKDLTNLRRKYEELDEIV